MTKRDMISEMVNLQDRLNNMTNGYGWRLGMTKDEKKIDWNLCIVMEVTECIGSLPWKHWKNIDSKPDIQNIKIELVDIFHFIMSELIRINGNEITVTILDKLLTNKVLNKFNNQSCIMIGKSIIKETLRNDIELVTIYFNNAISMVGLDIESLYKLYISKNVLNQFRQDNGYKDNRYKKIWNGKEDNIYLEEIINKGILNYDKIYTELQALYNALTLI